MEILQSLKNFEIYIAERWISPGQKFPRSGRYYPVHGTVEEQEGTDCADEISLGATLVQSNPNANCPQGCRYGRCFFRSLCGYN